MGEKVFVCLLAVVCLTVSPILGAPQRAAAVRVSPASLSFGAVMLNSQSAAQTIVITNESRRECKIVSVKSTLSEFVVIGPSTPLTLPEQGSASFQVVFLPTGPSTYAGSVSMVVENGRGQEETLSASLSGTGKQQATVQITTTSLPTATQGTAFSATLAATGGTAPYTWSVSSGALPIGISLSSSGVISGTPTGNGTSSFTVKVTDSTTPAAQTAQSLSITVVAAVTPVSIIGNSVPSGQVGTAYSSTLTASGGTAPYSWGISSGSLPGGLTLSSAGTISGTPTASGSFTCTVKVIDSTAPTAQTASESLTLAVAAAVTPVSITTTSLPAATQSAAFLAALVATGGTTPYTWSISAGSLPAGVTLAASTGVISGTPTAAGTSTFAVKVTDSTSPTVQTASANFSLTVASSSSYSVMLTWTASPSSGVTGYNVYRGSVNGGPYQLLTATPVSGLSYVDASVTSGTTNYYVTTAVGSEGDDSAYSSEYEVSIP